MLQIISFTVNGQPISLSVEEGESLLDTLRERLGLTSVKRGCEVGECGACTVLIDGKAVDSCIYLSIWAAGKSILTVEGLRKHDGTLTTIQQAFIDACAVQCGFCTPGLILSALELVMSGKMYTRDEIKKRISGHLCRCTGYENILNAIEQALRETNTKAVSK